MTAVDPFALVADRIVPGAALIRRWGLKGGVSAKVDALEIAAPDGTTRRVVVRRRGRLGGGRSRTVSPSTEFALLKALHETGVPVPEPVLLDVSGELFPSPYLVMAFVEGTTTIHDAALLEALRHMASALARLHALDPAHLGLPPLPPREDPIAGTLEYLPSTADTDRLRVALSARICQPNAPTLLHGDFWPGNILWRDGRIAAILDWEDAALGDPLCDLAGCRVELLWRHGETAMEVFTEHFLSLTSLDPTDLPVWELYVASSGAAYMSSWGLDPQLEAEMRRRTRTFLQGATRRVLS